MNLPNGIFPTMLIAYDKRGSFDPGAQGALLDWYIERGVHGVFALCHSTEVHWLSREEKAAVLKTTTVGALSAELEDLYQLTRIARDIAGI